MNKFKKVIILLVISFPFILLLKNIITGSIPFWYDPARDLLLALDNLKKPTLIGPPTGIPNIFYGPYWIWFLSLPLLVTHDPRFVTSIVLLIPNAFIFPLIFFKLFNKNIIFASLMWLLFFFSNFLGIYATQLWNPHLTPLFYLMLIFIIVRKHSTFWYLGGGFISGLIANIHVSFGVGVILASILFIVFKYFRSPTLIFSFILGVIISFLPNIIFEARHGFNQTKALFYTLENGFLYNSAVVGVTGLSKDQILSKTLSLIPQLTSLPSFFIYILLIIPLIRLRHLTKEQKTLFHFLLLTIITVFTIYINNRNPVWDYHFIGLETAFLILLTILVSNINWFKLLLIFWLIVLTIDFSQKEIKNLTQNPFALPTLNTKEYIIEKIYLDAGKNKFDISVYSPAIYTFDYDYLIAWQGKEKYGFIPEKDGSSKKIKYLIIPETDESIMLDFINYKTPNDQYQTSNTWKIPDKTTIIKREKK
ncbi:hypothetical protein HYW54_02210 [Candidatus Gottesmanbacteria bacterium]|nr:hypothetical protein [Candidatus Gottesmanbacteria bacterium]